MKIETNLAVYSEEVRKPLAFGREDITSLSGGYSRAGKIGLTKGLPLAVVARYFHEMGHEIEAAGGARVLYPDQVKQTRVRLNWVEAIQTTNFLFNGKESWLPFEIKMVCSRVMGVYTHWTFDPTRVEVEYVTSRQFENIFFGGNVNTMDRTEEADRTILVERFDAGARDSEIYSVASETAGLYILENSLNANRVFRFFHRPKLEFTLHYAGGMAYERAQNIIARAYAGTGWKLP